MKNRPYILVVLGIAFCVFGNALLMTLPISWDVYNEASEAIYLPSLSVQLFMTGLLMPCFEELLFRKFGYTLLRRFLPVLPSVLISAALFGIYHLNLIQFLYAGSFGVLLALCMEGNHTVFAPLAVHCSANIFSIVATNTVIGGVLFGFLPVRMGLLGGSAWMIYDIVKNQKYIY